MGLIMSDLFHSQTARQTGGMTARQVGRAFEQTILASQQDGQGPVCCLIQIKNFAKRIMVKSPNQPRGLEMRIVEEKSPCDFAGSVFGTGVGVFFDAKNCGEKIASFRGNDPAIAKPHQIHALQNLERASAFAGFLVRCERMGDYRFLWASRTSQSSPTRWDDPAWEVLGPIKDGYGVPLRVLFERYK